MKSMSMMEIIDNNYSAEQDLKALLEADEIREDKNRMNRVRKLAKDKLVDIAKISNLADEKPEPGDDDKGG